MRILLAHNNFTVQGGAEVFFHEIGRVLEKNGHTVAKFASFEDGLDASEADFFPPVADYKSGNILSKALKIPKIIYNRKAKMRFAASSTTSNPTSFTPLPFTLSSPPQFWTPPDQEAYPLCYPAMTTSTYAQTTSYSTAVAFVQIAQEVPFTKP
jgi:hypothetical protein